MTRSIPLLLLLFLNSLPNIFFSQNPTYVSENVHLPVGSSMAIYGDLYSNDSRVVLEGNVHFNTTASLVKSPGIIQIGTARFNMTESLTVENELGVNTLAEFNSGIVFTDRGILDNYFVHFLENADYTGLSSSTYVDGTVAKSGSVGFIYPIGHNNNISTLEMSAPANSFDQYKAYFLQDDVATILPITTDGVCATEITDLGYWLFNRTNGNDPVVATLNYDPGMLQGEDLCSNVVVSWDGSGLWQTEGNGSGDGDDETGGHLATGDGCTNCGDQVDVINYTYLTMATNVTILDVDFIDFVGEWITKYHAGLKWIVSKEINNEYFVIERSKDGINWEFLAEIPSLGDTDSERSYTYLDSEAYSSRVFYRIKQVDFDGHTTYCNQIVFLSQNDPIDKIKAYPNPVTTNLFVEIPEKYEGYTAKVYNSIGQVELLFTNIQNPQSMYLGNLAKGHYELLFVEPKSNKVKNVIKIIKN